MGILDALMGHGSEVAAKEVAGRLEGVLLPDETAKLAFRLFRDFFAFTEKRLIIVEIQGATGRKGRQSHHPLSICRPLQS